MSDDEQPDWLWPDKDIRQAEMAAKEKDFADLYLVFEDNPRGRALLEHLDNVYLHKRTPYGSSLDQYGGDEAVRAFIAGIHAQIKKAKERKV
jgi:hypothetical protein